MIGVDAGDTEFGTLVIEGTGQRIVHDVLAISEVFPGARSRLLPDLVVRWENLREATRIGSDEYGSFSAQPDTGRCGENRPRGFAALLGRRESG